MKRFFVTVFFNLHITHNTTTAKNNTIGALQTGLLGKGTNEFKQSISTSIARANKKDAVRCIAHLN